MNTTQMQAKWDETKAKLKQKYATLTDDDLMFKEGKEDEMYARLAAKISQSKEEVRKMISDL